MFWIAARFHVGLAEALVDLAEVLRPETLAEWASQPDTLRGRLRHMPAADHITAQHHIIHRIGECSFRLFWQMIKQPVGGRLQ